MAYTYSWLYQIQTIGLRFFTVYGPWGRPDMAPILFARSIRDKQPIKVFNNGNLSRDFTYIDDIIEGIIKIINRRELVREDTPGVPAVIYNIGHGSPVLPNGFYPPAGGKPGPESPKRICRNAARRCLPDLGRYFQIKGRL